MAPSPKVADATHPGAGSVAAEVADSMGGAQKALEAGHAATEKVDASTLEALRDAYQNGSYDVDADALADRILDDAFGEEWF